MHTHNKFILHTARNSVKTSLEMKW